MSERERVSRKGDRPGIKVQCVDHGADFTADEWAFVRAVDAYRRKHDVKFLAATDYLRIARGLGYEKHAKD